jgi:hypothetical protein
MAKGETVMPVPHGVISTSEGPVNPEEVVEEVVEVSTIAVEELTKDLVDVELPAGLDTE